MAPVFDFWNPGTADLSSLAPIGGKLLRLESLDEKREQSKGRSHFLSQRFPSEPSHVSGFSILFSFSEDLSSELRHVSPLASHVKTLSPPLLQGELLVQNVSPFPLCRHFIPSLA